MAWTQEDIDALKAAMAKAGILQRMRFADEEYEFRTMADAEALLAIMQAEVVSTAGRNVRLAVHSKGA